jgi:carbonic anhydrase
MQSHLAVVLLLLGVPHIYGESWGYSGVYGPETWCDSYPACCGTSQSPIDIDVAASVPGYIEAFDFHNYDSVSGEYTITNNGHTVKVSTDNTVYVSGGGLDGNYIFNQVHLHWGSTNDVGSEHRVNGWVFPAELHFVHWQESLGSIAEAYSVTGGLAVIGVLLELSDEDNMQLEPMISALEHVPYDGDTFALESFNFLELLPADRECFYRYSGSLTTPDCNESVIWTVLDSTIKISARQLEVLRSVYFNAEGEEDEHMEDNYRPIQALNGRTVYRSGLCNNIPREK